MTDQDLKRHVENALLWEHLLCGVGDFSYSLIEAKLTRLVLVVRQE